MPSVSIIVPVFNKESYLDTCLGSLRSQTCSDIEILCINNNSSDNSLNILNQAAKEDPRIVVLNELRQGVSYARNTGLEHATGDYIGFLDADDFIEPNFYERLVAAAQQYNAEISLCGFNEYYPAEDVFDRIILPRFAPVAVPKEVGINLFFVTTPIACTKIFKRSLVERCGANFDTSLVFAEDMVFSYGLLAQANKIAIVPEPLYHYRKDAHSDIDIDNKAFHGTQVLDAEEKIRECLERIDAPESIKASLPNSCVEQTTGALTLANNYAAYKELFDRFKAEWAPRMSELSEDKIVEQIKTSWEFFDNANSSAEYLFAMYRDRSAAMLSFERMLHETEIQRDTERRELAELESSITFRVGDALMRIPRKIRAVVRR